MLEVILTISAAALVFVVTCAEQCGHSKLEKLGFVLVLLGMAIVSPIALWLSIANPLADGTSLGVLDCLLLVMEVGLWVAIGGAGLVFVGAAMQTCRHRRTLFPFLYRVMSNFKCNSCEN